MIQLLRAFFPNWKFFEDLGTLPQLSYRMNTGTEPEQHAENSFGPWISPGYRQRSVTQILYNPKGNLVLALGSLLRQLEHDLLETDESDPGSLESRTSYQLVRHWVELELLRRHGAGPGVAYQFRILGIQTDPKLKPENSHGEVMLQSPIYILNPQLAEPVRGEYSHA